MGDILIWVITAYFVIINLAAFITYGQDKRKAERDEHRIPEKTLILLGFIGGPIGALLGMKVFHHKTKKNKFRILVPLSLVLWIFLWLFGAVQVGPSLQGDRWVKRQKSASTWMEMLPDDMLLSDVVLPGVHDAATNQVQLALSTRCQSESVPALLKDGYRYLDVRLGVKENKKGKEMYLMHGFTYCMNGLARYKIDRLLKDCTKFLKKNPSETIVFAVKYEHGDETVKAFEKLLDEKLEPYKSYVLFTDTMPTVSLPRALLLLSHRFPFEAGLGIRAGLPLLWEDQGGREDVQLAAVSKANGGYTVTVQDRYCYKAGEKWDAFTNTADNCSVREGSGDILINFLSTKGALKYGHPYYFAKKLNRELESWLTEERKQPQGWIVTDFGDAKQARLIYTLNE